MAIDCRIKNIVHDNTGRQSPCAYIEIFDDTEPDKVLKKKSIPYSNKEKFIEKLGIEMGIFSEKHNEQATVDQEIQSTFDEAKPVIAENMQSKIEKNKK